MNNQRISNRDQTKKTTQETQTTIKKIQILFVGIEGVCKKYVQVGSCKTVL